MTKFEESLRKIKPRKNFLEFNAGITYWYCLSDLIQKFGNWHSDEEFQQILEQNAELTRENNIVNQINSKLESQIADLKSQLQQQALPVVPEFVAEWIEILKTKGLKPLKNPETYGETGFTEETLQDIVFWISEHQEDYMRAWLDGYTVEKPQIEKPQLFYLKHIDFCKTDRHYDWFTIKHSDGPLNHLRVEKGQKPSTIDCKFTQQEIDSMQTGSYELVPVEDGE
ncbi:DUF1642 domain-containing protein [Lactococcus cremoris]|uniref:DUF1642 domain-containing protein n=1 Tax=Lactococcus lactis subsp. cremoris TaxID=1359 RepID=UPI002181FE61|nr:DUF1642 domain-containing protein [Lactococcus cremoris]MCT0478576.1 DUF1642 domain-containing protein [Lactococcus cremoris]